VIHKKATKAIKRAGIERLEIHILNLHFEATDDWPEFICKALPVDTRAGKFQRAKCFRSWEKCVEAVLEGYRPTIIEENTKLLSYW